MELVKDYDYSIHYHPSKMNTMINALSRKAPIIRGKIWEQLDNDVEATVTTMKIHYTIVE